MRAVPGAVDLGGAVWRATAVVAGAVDIVLLRRGAPVARVGWVGTGAAAVVGHLGIGDKAIARQRASEISVGDNTSINYGYNDTAGACGDAPCSGLVDTARFVIRRPHVL